MAPTLLRALRPRPCCQNSIFRPSTVTDTVNIVGHLFMPQSSGKVPAVLLMHGSGGIYDAMLDYWPKLLNAQGIAVFSLDRFGPRGVKSTAEDQSQVPFAADVADAFAALRLLASHPGIDAKRIAIMGFSRGGIASWRTAVETHRRRTGARRFALRCAHPGLFRRLRGRFPPDRQIGRILQCARTLVARRCRRATRTVGPCRDYSQSIADAGTPVVFVDFPGAYHKFDQDDQRRVFLRGAQRTVENCPLEVDIDTFITYDMNTHQRLAGEAYQQALKSCSAIGATVQGNKAVRDKAGEATVQRSCTKCLRSDAAIDQVGADLRRPFLWRSAVAEQCLAPFFRA